MKHENVEYEVAHRALEDATRGRIVDGICQQGWLRLQLGRFDWEVEFERGGEVCVALIPWSWAVDQKDILFNPAAATVALVTATGTQLVIARVITLRKVFDGDSDFDVNWTADFGYAAKRQQP